MDNGMSRRKEILQSSLVFEKMTSMFLGGLLGIEDINKSKLLGNKSGCLSFNQKVEMLIEIGALSQREKKKYQIFMEIRNQFMHNISANSYENCFKFLNGSEKFLAQIYPQPSILTREESLSNSVGELIDDVGKITAEIVNKIEDKIHKDIELEFGRKWKEAAIESIAEVKEGINGFILKLIKENQSIETKHLKNLGNDISKWFYYSWAKNFRKRQ